MLWSGRQRGERRRQTHLGDALLHLIVLLLFQVELRIRLFKRVGALPCVRLLVQHLLPHHFAKLTLALQRNQALLRDASRDADIVNQLLVLFILPFRFTRCHDDVAAHQVRQPFLLCNAEAVLLLRRAIVELLLVPVCHVWRRTVIM